MRASLLRVSRTVLTVTTVPSLAAAIAAATAALAAAGRSPRALLEPEERTSDAVVDVPARASKRIAAPFPAPQQHRADRLAPRAHTPAERGRDGSEGPPVP